jgi:uncharacterized membrane protein YqhA
MAADEKNDAASEAAEKRSRVRARRVTSSSRFIAAVPAVGLFICAVALSIATFVDVCEMVGKLIDGSIDLSNVAIECVEYADLFLLAVALYILSLGLVCLFVTDKLVLPFWLEFHDFDDLKERLASVICIMLGVYFLGYILEGHSGLDVLWLGLGSAIVIVALGFFVRNVFLHKE